MRITEQGPRRVWYADDPHVERPLVKTEDSAVGFYALNGESLVTFTEDETKERICEVLEMVREQNPLARILLVLDKHGSHICEYTRRRAHQLGIDLVFLPSGSPHHGDSGYAEWVQIALILMRVELDKSLRETEAWFNDSTAILDEFGSNEHRTTARSAVGSSSSRCASYAACSALNCTSAVERRRYLSARSTG